MTNKKKPEEKKVTYEPKSIKVPIPTFPPTAMVYSLPKSPNLNQRIVEEDVNPPVDIISAAIMAKVLEERQKELAYAKHCDTCTCSKKLSIIYNVSHHTIGTQTGEFKTSACLKCNENLTLASQLRLVKAVEPPTGKLIPIYPNNEGLESQMCENNVAKVQPNNFLVHKAASQSESSRSVANSNIHLLNVDVKPLFPEVNFFSANETSEAVQSKIKNSPNKTSPIDSKSKEIVESELSAKNESSKLKGSRYCAMRLQTGTKNILLDNAQHNVAPVLYTRNQKTKEESVRTHQNVSLNNTESSQSEHCKRDSIFSDNSTHNQQRVVDWIKSNLDNEISSSDNSQSEPLISRAKVAGIDSVKYAEMEEHVKRFLFGESEFLKTVEIGKLKYRTFIEPDVTEHVDNSSESNHSAFELDI